MPYRRTPRKKNILRAGAIQRMMPGEREIAMTLNLIPTPDAPAAEQLRNAIPELRRLANHIEQMDSGAGEVELLRTTVTRLEFLQSNPSTLEVTKIKMTFPLYDERKIYDVCRLLIEIRNSIRLPPAGQRKLKDESR